MAVATFPSPEPAPGSPVAGPDPASCPRVSAVTDWLVQQGLLRTPFHVIVEGFCRRLYDLGVPLWRGYATAQTLHPTIAALGASWRPATGGQFEAYIYRATPSDDYLQSPFRSMLDGRLNTLRLRLGTGETGGFPLLERFRGEGATDYVAHVIGFGVDGVTDGVTGVLTSWTAATPEGFSDGHLAIIEHLMPRFALALEARLGHDIAVNLLDTYVGPEAGRRVIGGEIRRGSLEVIPAVILLADLQGFTGLSDRLPRDTLIETLNAYFDCMVPVVTEHGGQVLKFMGDGLLATFPLDEADPPDVCGRALDAAVEILRCLAELNHERTLQDRPVMELDLVLHLGEVLYGNVGSADRLDFTVIGPAVNEASRIEALCGQYDKRLLVSETFARAATRSRDRLVAIGRIALRGVRTPQEIFTLEPDQADEPG
jgi:adenylate cyclase